MNSIHIKAFLAGSIAFVGLNGLLQELLVRVPVIHTLTLDWVPVPIRVFLDTGLILFACALYRKTREQNKNIHRFANAAWNTAYKYIQDDPQWKIWHPEPCEGWQETLQQVAQEDAEEV